MLTCNRAGVGDDAGMNDWPVVVALDLGTSSCKAVVTDASGRVRGAARQGVDLLVGEPGRAELDPQQVWQAATQVLCQVMSMAGVGATRGERECGAPTASCQPWVPLTLVLSGAMHTFLFCEADGSPRSAAVTWADSRAQATLADLRAVMNPDTTYQTTGCPVQATYHPARLWREHRAGRLQAVPRVVSIKEWIAYRLTGAWACDEQLASTTGLLGLREGTWCPAVLEAVGLRESQLSPVVPVDHVVGRVTSQTAGVTGLPAGLRVIVGGSDGGLANLGAGVEASGQRVITVGTSGAIRRISQVPVLDPQARTWCYRLDGHRFFAGGAINNGGLALGWCHRQFFADMSLGDMLAAAAGVPAGCDGLRVQPYLTGERSPCWRPEATGTCTGLRLSHTRAHLARAVIEGVAACLADVWDAMPPREADGPDAHGQPVRMTGGLVRSPVACQVIADMLGVTLELIEVEDASALGAAMIGWRAMGQPDWQPRLNEPAAVLDASDPRCDDVEMVQGAGVRLIVPDPQRQAFYRAWRGGSFA